VKDDFALDDQAAQRHSKTLTAVEEVKRTDSRESKPFGSDKEFGMEENQF